MGGMHVNSQLFGKDFFLHFPDKDAPFSEKSVKQGEAWRAMSDEGRAHYDRMAAAELIAFKGAPTSPPAPPSFLILFFV